jgi:hypothetical protein
MVRIPIVAASKRNTRAISPPALSYPIIIMVSSVLDIENCTHLPHLVGSSGT